MPRLIRTLQVFTLIISPIKRDEHPGILAITDEKYNSSISKEFRDGFGADSFLYSELKQDTILIVEQDVGFLRSS